MIPLELGGHPTAPRNLWPELLPLAFKADRLESALHRSVCEGKLSLSDAQQRIVAYKHVNG